MRGTVWMLVCVGFQAAREPSAKSTRNDSDEPPWFSLKRVIGCVRTRSSSSSSDMPRKVPDASSATRRSGSSDRSSRAASGPAGAMAWGASAAAQPQDARTPRRSPRRRAKPRRWSTRPRRTRQGASRARFYRNRENSPVRYAATCRRPRFCLLHVPQADRRRRQGHQVLGQHLQLGPGEVGLLLRELLGQPPAQRPPPQRLLHREEVAAPRGLMRGSGCARSPTGLLERVLQGALRGEADEAARIAAVACRRRPASAGRSTL